VVTEGVRTVLSAAAGRVRSSAGLHNPASLLPPASAGLLFGLSFPPSPLERAGWAAAAVGFGLIVASASRARDVREAFRAGAVFGLVGYGAALRGIFLPMGPLALLALAYTVLLAGVWAALVRAAPVRVRFLAAPVLWVAAEAARGWLLGGFYWDHLAVAAVEWERARVIAGILSREAVALAVVAGGAGLASLALRRHGQGAVLLAVALTAFAPVWPSPQAVGKTVRVAAVQTWHDNLTKWMPASLPGILRELGTLTARAAQGRAELVVWPETAVPADPLARPEVKDAIVRAARRAPVLAGALVGPPRLGPAARLFYGPVSSPRPVNVLLLVDRKGNLRGVYAKSVAFPYGEQGLLTGPGFVPISSPAGRLGGAICWENSIPSAAFEYARRGANILAVPANLAWFGPVVGSQYLAHSRLLAAEMRVPVVQSVNRGRSAVIAADGSVLSLGPARGPGAASAEVVVPPSPSRAPLVGAALRAASVVSSLLLAAVAGSRERPRGLAPVRDSSLIPSLAASAAVVAVSSVLFAGGYVVAGFPMGHPSPLMAAVLLTAGLLLGYLWFGPVWAWVSARYGEGSSQVCAVLGIWVLARVLLPVEAMGWVLYQVLPLCVVRRKWGDALGPSGAVGIAAVLAPVWVAVV